MAANYTINTNGMSRKEFEAYVANIDYHTAEYERIRRARRAADANVHRLIARQLAR